jgi:uncharacterized membrane protein
LGCDHRTAIPNCLSNSERIDSPGLVHNLHGCRPRGQRPSRKLHLNAQGADMSDLANTSDSSVSGLSDNAAAGIAYITIIPAIVFLIIEPFKRSSFVRFHAWQSIFFFVAWAVVDILIGVLQNIVPSVGFPTYMVLELVGLAIFVIWLIVFIGAFNGKRYKLPIIGDLAEKQASR